MAEQCETCRFYREYEGRDEGRCNRHPPQLSDHAVRFYAENPGDAADEERIEEERMLRALRGLDVWFQPSTHCSDWCGEWRAKTAPVEVVPVPGETEDERRTAYQRIIQDAVARRVNEWNWPKGNGRASLRSDMEYDLFKLAGYYTDWKHPPEDVGPALALIRGADLRALLRARVANWKPNTPRYLYAMRVLAENPAA